MGKRTFEDVKKYVEWQSQGKCNVLSAKPEQHFDDLGVDVCVWNVKTDTDGDWWVVEGDGVPIALRLIGKALLRQDGRTYTIGSSASLRWVGRNH